MLHDTVYLPYPINKVSDMNNDQEYTRKSVQFPNDLNERLEAEAKANRRSFSGQVVLIVEDYYNQAPTYKFLTDRDSIYTQSDEEYRAALKRLNDSLPDEMRQIPNEPDRPG